ncbi:hypothetical protein [Modestobacter sp. DSM 44400]|uniref:hypothetical protein n=1 Tax=Modestobacter sp. DSM 44400 TaxID=1550230 RepID=UPI0011150661|nr:hypothetical protein [Modestobacter sp. DSM 44400]
MTLLATSGKPGGAEVLTGAVLPLTGSILGLVAAFGIAVPLVAGWSLIPALLVPAVVGVVAVLVVSSLSNAVTGWGPVADSGDAVLRTESPWFASGVLWLLVALWLFTRRARARHTPEPSAR